MGGSAEEIIFGKVSTGASDDIQKTTELAERAVTIYGMSDKLGPIAFEKMQQQFIEGYGNARRNVSSEVAKVIDAEVKQMVDSAHHIALTILDKNRDLLEEISRRIVGKRNT